MSFATDTAVTGTGPGTWSAEIVDGWDIGGNASGGYLLAIAARAAASVAERPDPVTVTAHYLAPGRPGIAKVETSLRRKGTRFATAQATLSSTRPLLAVLGTFGNLERASAGPERVDAAPPDLPPPEECPRLESAEAFPPPFMARVELRLHPDDAGFADGRPSGSPRMRGWFRLADDEPIDTIGLLVAVDAFPPTVFNARLPLGWVPTIELTAHIRARPAGGWLRCAFSTRFVTGGFLEEDGEVWDDTGRLVAQSRQLALLPRA